MGVVFVDSLSKFHTLLIFICNNITLSHLGTVQLDERDGGAGGPVALDHLVLSPEMEFLGGGEKERNTIEN